MLSVRHVLLDKGIKVIAIRVIAIRVIIIKVKLKDFKDILYTC